MPLDDETFIAAILEQPQEEANRVVYADWLEERGDPRAALYRQRRLTNSIGMEFVLVPRGSFRMGADFQPFFAEGLGGNAPVTQFVLEEVVAAAALPGLNAVDPVLLEALLEGGSGGQVRHLDLDLGAAAGRHEGV
jgi:uncharacterized protein (TIGR02996 family)